MNSKTRKGFTLIEVLLVFAVMGLILGMGIPIYQQTQTRNDLDVAVSIWMQSARRAQFLSQASDSDTVWGIYIQAEKITVFKGSNYATRDVNYDEDFAIGKSVSFSGNNEIVFSKFYGVPSVTGNTILSDNNNELRTITINSKGTVSF